MGSWATLHRCAFTERKSLSLAFLLAACIWSISCGGDLQQQATINNGNWWITGKSTSDSTRMFYAAGPLVQTGNSVAGSFKVGNWAADYLGLNAGTTLDCLTTDDTVDLSGSFNGKKLTLAGNPKSGGSLIVKLEGANESFSGTYTVNSASCTGTGTVSASVVRPLNGTWAGNVYYSDGAFSGVSVNIQITQGTFNSADGSVPLTGSGTAYLTNPNNPRQVTPTPCPVDSSFLTGDRVAITCGQFFVFQGAIADPAGPTHILGPTSIPRGYVDLTKSN